MTPSEEEVVALFASTPGDEPGDELFEELQAVDDGECFEEPDEAMPSRFWTGGFWGAP